MRFHPRFDRFRWATVVALLVAATFVGCKKKDDDAPPPLPAPSAAPAPTQSAPIAIAPEEDAGSDASDAAPDVKKATGGGGAPDTLGLRACCNALQQNAASMPPPQNMYAMQAAVLCQSLAAQGQTKAGALGSILGALKGAGAPAACK